VDPVEVQRDLACLVRLRLADEVPGQAAVAQRFDLRQAFLQVVLAEVPQAEPGRGGERRGVLALADGQKRDGVDTPAALCRGGGDPGLHGADVVRKILRKD